MSIWDDKGKAMQWRVYQESHFQIGQLNIPLLLLSSPKIPSQEIPEH